MYVSLIQSVKDQYPLEKGYKITHHRFTLKSSYVRVTVNNHRNEDCVVAFKPSQVYIFHMMHCYYMYFNTFQPNNLSNR